MKIAFKSELKLSAAKKLLKEFKVQGAVIRRTSADCALLKDPRNRSFTLCFKSNLELKGLI